MGRCQLAAGRKEGMKEVKTLSEGAVSAPMYRIEPQKTSCGEMCMDIYAVVQTVADVGEVCLRRPVATRILVMRSGIPYLEVVLRNALSTAQGVFQIRITFGEGVVKPEACGHSICL